MSETLTMANPIETEKIRTHHAKIVVECTTGKPYYSIEWFDTAKQEYYLGYSLLKDSKDDPNLEHTRADLARSVKQILGSDGWKKHQKLFPICREYWE